MDLDWVSRLTKKMLEKIAWLSTEIMEKYWDKIKRCTKNWCVYYVCLGVNVWYEPVVAASRDMEGFKKNDKMYRKVYKVFLDFIQEGLY